MNTVAELIKENCALRLEIASLREKLALAEKKGGKPVKANSKNSSMPPSSDQKTECKESSNKGGAQKGHPGHSRKLLPRERVDSTEIHSLEKCPFCKSKHLVDRGEGQPFQYISLEDERCVITEHHRKRYRCKACKRQFSAHLPEGIGPSPFSPRLQSAIGMLTGHFRLSKLQVRELLKQLLGVSISVGAICKTERRLTEALEPAYAKLKTLVQQGSQPVYVDETSWRNRGKTHFVWLACSKQYSFFHIAPTRSKKDRDVLLGESFKSPIITDRYAVYSDLQVEHQYCLAHLKRNFKRFAEGASDAKWIAEEIIAQLNKLFRTWQYFQGNKISRSQLYQRAYYRRQNIEALLNIGCLTKEKVFVRLCKKLLNDFSNLWLFVKREGVEPTNNEAERSLRSLVLYRKTSLGTKSAAGMRFVSVISTVCQTLRKQGENILTFLTQAVEGCCPSMV